jgi:hypothetical protein
VTCPPQAAPWPRPSAATNDGDGRSCPKDEPRSIRTVRVAEQNRQQQQHKQKQQRQQQQQ